MKPMIIENTELISLIVPMYNVSEYITDCIESIKKQIHQNFECLLIDDGSTDETLSVLKPIIEEDKRFKLLQQKNSGPAKARNTGLKEVQGEYVLFVDSDDKLGLNSIQLLLNTAKEQDADITIGKTERFDNTKTWAVTSHQKYQLNLPGQKQVGKNPELFYAMGPAAKLFKSELIKAFLFDEKKRFAEDQSFVFKSYVTAKKIYVIEEAVYYYRVRETDESLTQQYRKQPAHNLQVFLNLMEEVSLFTDAEKIENSDIILKDYFNRLFEIELRVLFKSMLLKKSNEQILFYKAFLDYFKKNQKIIVSCSNFYQFIITEQLDYLFLVKRKSICLLLDIFELAIDTEDVLNDQEAILTQLVGVTNAQINKKKIASLFRKLKAGR